MSVINAIPLLLGGEGYQISRSVRLRSAASAYFSYTNRSSTNRTSWTWSSWVKRGSFGVYQSIFAFRNASGTYSELWFTDTNTLRFSDLSSSVVQCDLTTNSVYRDPAGWYHIQLTWDSANSTSGNRVLLYVNGERITSFSTATYPAQNTQSIWNYPSLLVNIGRESYTPAYYFDGYLTEVNFIDGQALTPSSFGETDSITGVWKPKKYAGTYGTNGFYLNFSDNSSNTATTIGKDNSGNGNNWTPNNISVTAGATYDSMIDVPTLYADGGNGRGNYAVLNPLQSRSAPSRANLEFIQPNAGHGPTVGTIGMTTGKWYWEVDVTTFSSGTSSIHIGIVGDNYPFASGNYIGNTATSYAYRHSGQKYNNAASSAYGGVYGAGNVIGVALDLDAGTLTFYLNNVSQGTAYSGLSGTFYPGISVEQSGSTSTVQANFGQRPFAYTPPTGFKALNTQNLPEPTIKKGNQYFNATTYTGNGTSTGNTQVITNSGSMQPDFVWIKSRSSGTQFHMLNDSVRGTNKLLYSNSTGAEDSLSNVFSSFNSNGFTVDYNSTYSQAVTNANGSTYVGWQWKESASAGFDIVTYSGDSTTPRAISHNLGVTPGLVILKCRSNATNYRVYHSSFGTTTSNTLYLNLTNAVSTTDTERVSAVSSSTFTVTYNSGGGDTNTTGRTYVAYLFAEVAGFSKFGSYTGNGSADGPFVFTGFRPRYVMIKNTSGVGDWVVVDTARNTNGVGARLYADLSDAEYTGDRYDQLSNGFKIRTTSTESNTSGSTYIYAAFAESPFKTSLAR